MADEYNRRKTDKRLDTLETNLRADIKNSLASHIDEHLEEYHAFKAPELLVMVDEHNEMVGSVDRIVNLLEGEPQMDLSGNIVKRTGGMIRKQTSMAENIDTIYDRTNGGVTVTQRLNPQWSRGQKIAAAGLGVSIFFAALPGVVAFFHWLAELWVL